MADLAAAGLSAEQLALVMELAATVAIEARPDEATAALERRRKSERERKARSRAVTGHHGTARDKADKRPLDKKGPQTPKELIPREIDSLPACEDLEFPDGVTVDLWIQYRAMRRKIRKPLTPNAERLALKHLRAFAEDGHPPGAIVEAAIVGSYQGLFAPKGPKNGSRKSDPEHEWGSTVAAANSVIAELSGGEGFDFDGRRATPASITRRGG